MVKSNMELDLQGCKDIATLMTQVEPVINEAYPVMLAIHPFSAYRIIHIPPEEFDPNNLPTPEMVDIISDLEGRKRWQKSLMERIDKAPKVEYILFLLNGPYLMNYLRLIEKYIYSEEKLADLLKYCWTNQEFPNWNERGQSLRTCLRLFKKAKHYIMDEDERDIFDSLPEEITIYRGQYNDGKHKDRPYPALSWTTDSDRAFWFVTHRYSPNGIMYKAQIKRKDVVCYLNNRGEQELIIDYTKIYNVEVMNYE